MTEAEEGPEDVSFSKPTVSSTKRLRFVVPDVGPTPFSEEASVSDDSPTFSQISQPATDASQTATTEAGSNIGCIIRRRGGDTPRWRLNPKFKSITPRHIREAPSFRRNKLTLLSMGVAVVLVANVTFLAFLTPPESPAVPLAFFNLPENQQLDGDPTNGFMNFLINKELPKFPNGTIDTDSDLDFSTFSVDDYRAMFTVLKQEAFCPNHVYTAFHVFNGFAFSFAVATLFLVAVVPVFIRRQHWDAYLATVGAIGITITLIMFVAAFVLAGFVSAGVGAQSALECDSVTSAEKLKQAVETGNTPRDETTVLSAAAYVTLGMVVFLVMLVLVLSIKDTPLPQAISKRLSTRFSQMF